MPSVNNDYMIMTASELHRLSREYHKADTKRRRISRILRWGDTRNEFIDDYCPSMTSEILGSLLLMSPLILCIIGMFSPYQPFTQKFELLVLASIIAFPGVHHLYFTLDLDYSLEYLLSCVFHYCWALKVSDDEYEICSGIPPEDSHRVMRAMEDKGLKDIPDGLPRALLALWTLAYVSTDSSIFRRYMHNDMSIHQMRLILENTLVSAINEYPCVTDDTAQKDKDTTIRGMDDVEIIKRISRYEADYESIKSASDFHDTQSMR